MERVVIDPRMGSVPVDGGELVYGEWGDPSAPPVLATHGITASHLAWSRLAEALPDRRIIAPDLRGRGGSAGLPGPWGMATHAADMVRLLDGLGLDRVRLVGHSMGAFVAAATAARLGERATGVLLVDGGVPFAAPPGLDLDAAITATLGPALARLALTFPDRATYREFWAGTPALGPLVDDDAVRAYLDYDLVGDPLHPAASPDAVAQDSHEFYGEEPAAVLAAITAPVAMLWVPRGLQNETPGLYTAELLAPWTSIATRFVDGFNHYTIVMTAPGAAEVAAALVELS
ncbi:alpha/beta fold hydrolase [Pseudolysinimonas sp.]|uniref:alpha/beta fold hydrolase n=1 Tax=Pseudolysinimonas sp. TaxID=2680009 RepID=UPI003F8090A6